VMAPLPAANVIGGRGKEGDDFFNNTRSLEKEEVKKMIQEAQEAPKEVRKILEQSNDPPDTSMRQEEEGKAEEPKAQEVPEPSNNPPERQANAPIGPIFEVIPKATQAKDLLKAQILEPIGKRENFAVNVRTQNRQEKLTRKRAMTVARYLEEPHPDSSKGKKESKPREEEKGESLPDLPPFEEEETTSSITNAVAAKPEEAHPEKRDSPPASQKEEDAPPPIRDETSMSIQHDEPATSLN